MTTTAYPTTPAPLVLVPCAATKADHSAPAAEAYTSSTFRMAIAAARSLVRPYGHGDECIRIVSAKHGLLHLDDIVDPYDCTIGDVDTVDPSTIRAQAVEQGLTRAACPIVLCGRRYVQLIEASGAWDNDTLILGVAGKEIGDTRSAHKHVVTTEAHRTTIVEGWR